MTLNPQKRRPTFEQGVDVRLTDGGVWTLPIPSRDHPEDEALLACVLDAEDRAGVLVAELALTVFLLGRNYDLSPEQIAALLSFPDGDPALAALQGAVHAMVLDVVGQDRPTRGSRGHGGYPGPGAQATPPNSEDGLRLRASWAHRVS